MIDAKRILDQLVSSGVAGGLAGGLAGGALANSLSSKKVRKVAGSALQVGGLALVGGLAYKAWKSYQGGAAASGSSVVATPQPDTAFLPDSGDQAGTAALGMLIARSIIAAAKSDGQIDAGESQAITQQINSLDLPLEDKAFLFEEYGRPIDTAALAAAVDTPEHAAEVYTASLLTVDPPSQAEERYLNSLAEALGLEPGLVGEIHSAVRADREAA